MTISRLFTRQWRSPPETLSIHAGTPAEGEPLLREIDDRFEIQAREHVQAQIVLIPALTTALATFEEVASKMRPRRSRGPFR